MASFCIELFCVVTLQYQMMVRIAIAYFIIEKRKLRHSLGRPSRSDFVQSKVVVQKALDETQLLFDSLMQEYFG